MSKIVKDNTRTITEVVIIAAIVLILRMLIEKLLPYFYEAFGLYFSDFLFQTLSNYILTIGMVGADIYLIILIYRKIEYGTKNIERLFLEMVVVLFVSFLSSIILRFIQSKDISATAFFDKLFLFTWVTYLIFNGIVVMISDVILYSRRSHKLALAEQVKEKSMANYQYQLLKGQLNPHFLFNSLNVLDYLIQTDQEKASDYVKRLASIYRYLLKIESQPIVMVEEEAAFVKQYINLLQERFGAALSFDIDIPDSALTKKIIPCGIQMLIENAVKHNVANTSRVLRIVAFGDGDYIVVKNNIQPKMMAVTTTGIGLKSIKKQYQILFNKEILITEDENFFEVRIPLVD